jgi:putative ABC transport system substrate-binding protein
LKKQGNDEMSINKKMISFIIIVIVCFSGCIINDASNEKIYKIGVLWTGGEFFTDLFDSFKMKMMELDYIEGKNIIYEVYMAPLPVGNEQIIQKYVDENVDMIFSFATEATIEAKKVAEGSGIPIVFTCTFIEGTNLVNSLSKPGDNITGVRYPTTESAMGRLEYLHEVAPDVVRVWIPYLKDYPTVTPQINVLKPLALELNLTILEGAFTTPQEIKDYLNSHNDSIDIGMDAILMMAEPFSVTPEAYNEVYKFSEEHKIPVSSAIVLNESYGPVIGFHPTNTKMGSMAAMQVDKILKGKEAGDVPILTSDNDLRINYKLAKQLGLKVSEELLAMAIEIIR